MGVGLPRRPWWAANGHRLVKRPPPAGSRINHLLVLCFPLQTLLVLLLQCQKAPCNKHAKQLSLSPHKWTCCGASPSGRSGPNNITEEPSRSKYHLTLHQCPLCSYSTGCPGSFSNCTKKMETNTRPTRSTTLSVVWCVTFARMEGQSFTFLSKMLLQTLNNFGCWNEAT